MRAIVGHAWCTLSLPPSSRPRQFRADMDAATAAAAREKSELERNLLQQSEAAVASANRDSASIIASLKVRDYSSLDSGAVHGFVLVAPRFSPLVGGPGVIGL